MQADGTIHSDAETPYALAIVFGLLDAEAEQLAGKRLAELVAESGWHIRTGFAGTPFVTHALTRTGHLDDAYRLLLQRECPSWLYPVTMGATTIWERWDSMLPDGTINPGQMTSFNHYAFGAVAHWMHQTIGGLSPVGARVRQGVDRPAAGRRSHLGSDQPGDTARAGVGLLAGRGRLTLDLELPDQVTALVRLPDGTEQEVGAGRHQLTPAS